MMYNMATVKVVLSFSLVFSTFVSLTLCRSCDSSQWPVPIRRYGSRPISDPYCQAGVIPFCPTGEAHNSMPLFHPDDKVEIYALKKPVWQFKFGDAMAKFNIWHDAIGIKNVNTGLNYTMEWYELFQLFNCTFPHLREKSNITWCNQGATCIYDGIEDKLWKDNGTLVKVATTTGDTFNKFSQWVLVDNNTGLYYETWTVKSAPDGEVWFSPFDCASWVIRAFEEMGNIGVQFNQSVKLNYTRITLFSDKPKCLGNASDIFRPFGKNHRYAKDIVEFYSNFQAHKPIEEMIGELLEALFDVLVEGEFFLYYNSEYWSLPMKEPFLRLSYELVPLPSNNININKT